MKTQNTYCSACDRDVKVVITDGPSHDGHANLHDAEVVCLEIGDHCTGNLCPIGATPPAVMAARLVTNGLQSAEYPVALSKCDGCGRVTSHVVIDSRFSTCTECGATRQEPAAPPS